MAEDGEITEITAPVELAVVGDRLHFVLTSGGRKRTFAITFHKARNAAQATVLLLDEHDRNQSVTRLKSGRGGH